MKSLVCVLVTGTALILGASSARADEVAGAPEPARPSEPTPSFAASRAGLFATVWPGRDNLSMVIGAELQLQVARRTFLDLSYAGSFASVRANASLVDCVTSGTTKFGGVRGVWTCAATSSSTVGASNGGCPVSAW